MQSPVPQPQQVSPSTPARRPRIYLRPVLGGIALSVMGAKNLGPALEQWQRWDRLQTEGQRTTAQLLTTQAAIATASGKTSSYKVSYEFVAPTPGYNPSLGKPAPSELLPHRATQTEATVAESASLETGTAAMATEPAEAVVGGSALGSSTSAAEIQAMLQDQFWNPTSDGRFRTSTSEESSVEGNGPVEGSALPPGQRFFQGRQTLSEEDYRQLGLSNLPLTVIYDAQEPSNSAIAGTGSYPTGKLAFLLLLLLGGAGLLTLGLMPLWPRSSNHPV